MLLIQGAFIRDGKQLVLHPALDRWQQPLARSAKLWAKHTPMLALQWYLWRQGWHEPVAALLASKLSDIEQKGVQQYWVVSPYHASVARGSIEVMPDQQLAWTEQDAQWLVELLNPMLKTYHIELFALGACLLAKSFQVYDVNMVEFASFSGGYLPNRMPDGNDALRFMCMISEMQVLLAQSPAEHRQKNASPDIRGIWFWGMSTYCANSRPWPRVFSHDQSLLSLLDDGESTDIYTNIEHLGFLEKIPKYCVLASKDITMLAETCFIPRFSRQPWQPRQVKSLQQMHQHLSC